MVGIDTNIVVRFLTRDDTTQFEQSLQIFQTQDVFIPDTVLLESEWVLRFAYAFEPNQISSAFRKLLGLPNVAVQNAQQISLVIDWHEQGLDFADAMHLAASQNHAEFQTFDKDFVKKSQGLTNCTVTSPDSHSM